MTRRLAVVATAASLALVGCGGANFEEESATNVAVAEQLPAPTLADVYSETRDARIGPGDQLVIEVLDAPDLTRQVVVDGQGTIMYPLIGTVDTLALTPRELAGRIGAQLGERYLRDPQVTVRIAEAVSQRFTIIGGVAQPGQYPAPGGSSLTDAISFARGLSDDARMNEVVVFRTVDGTRMAARFNLADITGGRADDPLVFPRDRIVVGTNSNRALLRDVAAVTPLLGVFYQIF